MGKASVFLDDVEGVVEASEGVADEGVGRLPDVLLWIEDGPSLEPLLGERIEVRIEGRMRLRRCWRHQSAPQGLPPQTDSTCEKNINAGCK